MQAWDNFLLGLEKQLSPQTVSKWLRPLKVIRFDACNLYLQAFDSFQIAWFEEHIRPLVIKNFINSNQKKIKIHLQLLENKEIETKPAPTAKNKKINQTQFELRFESLLPHCTFQNFVCSADNTLPFRLLGELCNYNEKSQTVSKGLPPNVSFNPIYLYGEKGVGKTHLLMATANALIQGGNRVLYTSAETFTEHVVGAIRSSEMQKFRKAYRNVDTLLIDDIEVFSRKGATQEEFFHTFNTLHVEGKQIILSASVPPGELKSIEPRLISRFEWGLVLPLTPLSPVDIDRLLDLKAQIFQFPLQERVKEFLKKTFVSSPKTLHLAFDTLILRARFNQNSGGSSPPPVSLETAQAYLSELIQQESQTALTPKKIIENVASFYGIPIDDILGKSQSHDCVVPRQIAMYLCRNHLNMPYMKIGEFFLRDHSTVIASVKLIRKNIESSEKSLLSVISGINKQLKS